MEKHWLISRLVTLFYYLRFDINFLLGRTFEQAHLQLDARYLALTRKLQGAFEDYDPVYRDFVTSLLERKRIAKPTNLNRRSAVCATDVLMIIELMQHGKLPPDCLMPLIEPWQISYYYERMSAYVDMLYSDDHREQRIPMPFFNMIASERMFKLLQEQPATTTIPSVAPVSVPAVAKKEMGRSASPVRIYSFKRKRVENQAK
jgi:hypothetical protein